MRRRPVLAVALVAAAAVSIAPAHAATKKPKPVKGSYTLNLMPDPTVEATEQVKDGCGLLLPSGQDKHPFTVPGKGSLHVVLDSANPVPSDLAGADWDLYVLDADGSILDSSTGATAHEETTDTFKSKQAVTFWACNLLGEPNATVTYTFTPR